MKDKGKNDQSVSGILKAAAAGEDKGVKDFHRRHSRIFELYNQGMTISEIARETNMDEGKVQLIFNLKENLKAKSFQI